MASPRFTILVDLDCPLCRKEAAMLRWLDRGRGRLEQVNIADPSFDASTYGTTFERVMGEIHGVMPDGKLITGMEVFRRAYAAVGLGWVLAPTRWPILRTISDACYRWFARNRLRLFGRAAACEADRCGPRTPASSPSR